MNISNLTHKKDNTHFEPEELNASFGRVASVSIRIQNLLSRIAAKKVIKLLNPRLNKLREEDNLNYSESVELQILESRVKLGMMLAASTIIPTIIPGIRPSIYGIYYLYTSVRIRIIENGMYKQLDDILAEVEDETYTEN